MLFMIVSFFEEGVRGAGGLGFTLGFRSMMHLLIFPVVFVVGNAFLTPTVWHMMPRNCDHHKLPSQNSQFFTIRELFTWKRFRDSDILAHGAGMKLVLEIMPKQLHLGKQITALGEDSN
jgi:hypothetical protein